MKSKEQQAFEALGYRCRSYSGRGMFGKYCLGVVIDPCEKSLLHVGAELQFQLLSMAKKAYEQDCLDDEVSSNWDLDNSYPWKGSVSHDTLGHDIILYFPNIPYEDTEEDDEEEEEEDD